MAHQDTHTHHAVVEDRTGYGAGLLVAIAALILLALVAFAVLWTRPWDDNNASNTNPNVPGITDNSGPSGGSQDGGDNSGGTSDGGGSGGGDAQPAQ